MKRVVGRDYLNISLDNLVTRDEVNKWPHLQDITDKIGQPDIDLAGKIHLLIAVDQPDILALRESRRGGRGKRYAILTCLGWTLNRLVIEGQETLREFHSDRQLFTTSTWKVLESRWSNPHQRWLIAFDWQAGVDSIEQANGQRQWSVYSANTIQGVPTSTSGQRCYG